MTNIATNITRVAISVITTIPCLPKYSHTMAIENLKYSFESSCNIVIKETSLVAIWGLVLSAGL
jgi:type III secretory pathway component EscT